MLYGETFCFLFNNTINPLSLTFNPHVLFKSCFATEKLARFCAVSPDLIAASGKNILFR